MTEHILVTYATRRRYRTIPTIPDRAQYDPARGYWLMDHMPLVAADEFVKGAPITKKCDQETGEDQKGE